MRQKLRCFQIGKFQLGKARKKLDGQQKNAFCKATGFVTLRVDALSVPCASHHPHRSDIGKDLTERKNVGGRFSRCQRKRTRGNGPQEVFCRFKWCGYNVLLMVHQLRLVVYPSFYRVFIHPRSCRISSINSMNILMWGKIWPMDNILIWRVQYIVIYIHILPIKSYSMLFLNTYGNHSWGVD